MHKFPKPTFFPVASRGRLHRLHKEVWLYVNLEENYFIFHLIFDLRIIFSNELMLSVCSFMPSLIQHDVHLVKTQSWTAVSGFLSVTPPPSTSRRENQVINMQCERAAD